MILTTAIATSLIAAPQNPPTSGIFSSTPVVVIGEDTNQVDNLELRYAGAPPNTVVDLDAIAPRYKRGAMFPGLSSSLRLGSFSLGNSLLTTKAGSNNTVVQEVPEEGWGFTLYSVNSTTNSSAPYSNEPSGQLEGDVFSVIFRGSEAVFAEEEIFTVEKARDGGSMGMSSVNGIDGFMAAYALDEPIPEDTGIIGSKFYFTLSSVNGSDADYASIPTSWQHRVNGLSTLANLDDWQNPSTIFVVEHLANGTWSTPLIYKYHAELGLSKHQGNDSRNPYTEIDALSVMRNADSVGPTANGAQLALSTTDQDLDLQLWCVGYWSLVNDPFEWGPLYAGDGSKFVVSPLGLSDADDGITGFCIDDPGPVRPDLLSNKNHRARISRNGFPAYSDPLSASDPELHAAAHRVSAYHFGSDGFYFEVRDTSQLGFREATLWAQLGYPAGPAIQITRVDMPGGSGIASHVIPAGTGSDNLSAVYFWTATDWTGSQYTSRQFQFWEPEQ